MNSFPVTPIGSLIFIEPAPIDDSPIKVIESPRASWRGVVLAVGPDATECRVGDVVRLKPSQAIDAVFHRTKVWIVREENILAVEEAA
jgi:hypothetical protein